MRNLKDYGIILFAKLIMQKAKPGGAGNHLPNFLIEVHLVFLKENARLF
jgi:hypothetical protein